LTGSCSVVPSARPRSCCGQYEVDLRRTSIVGIGPPRPRLGRLQWRWAIRRSCQSHDHVGYQDEGALRRHTLYERGSIRRDVSSVL
jgi:hypothetical protein